MRLGGAYNPHTSLLQLARELIHGEWRTKMRPEALIFAGRAPAQGLDGHGPPRRDHGADAGDGRA